MAMDANTQSSSQNKRCLVKKLGLGSCEGRVQDKEIALLRLWLTSQKELSEEDLKKICKGVFYFILNADKQACQGASFGNLPSTVANLDLNLAKHYFQSFFMKLKSEWRGVDLFRLDMFYLLLVRILRGMFSVFGSNGWDLKLVDGFLGGMAENSLLVAEKLPIQKMNFRFADGYLNEFHCVFPVQLDTFVPMTEPFYSFFAKGLSRLLLNRVDDNVFSCFLKNRRNLLKIRQEGQDVDDKVENLGSITLSSSLSQQVTFPSTLQDNEKVLHDSQRDFKGLSKPLIPSGILFLLESIMKLKMFRNTSAEQSVDSKALSIKELPADSVSSIHKQHVNKTESLEQIGEEVQNEFDTFVNKISEGLTWKCDGQAATGIVKSSEMKSNSEAEEIRDFQREVTFKYACSYGVAKNEVNGGERLELLDGESGDLKMTDVSVISDPEQHFEETVLAELDNCTSLIPSLSVPISPLQTGSKKRKWPQSGENELPGSLSPIKDDENGEEFACSDLLSGVASTGKSGQRKAATGIVKSSEMKSNSEAEEIRDFQREVTFKYACSLGVAKNEVNGAARLELLDGESGDLKMTDVSVISDHEQHFEETVLAELDNCTSPIPSLSVPISPLQTGSKKRKWPQSGENELLGSLSPIKYDANEEEFVCSDLLSGVTSTGKSGQRKVKRVRFSLKNNLVWKPYSPLPPEILRVPPSATPRGSALKKGVPPGPICIIKNSPRKKPALRQRSVSVRKTPKNTKSVSASSMVLRSQRPIARPEISHAKEVEERSSALASSREHQKEVDQADCSLRAFFVLKGHNFRQEADNCGTVLGI